MQVKTISENSLILTTRHVDETEQGAANIQNSS
jgi:hypothetical protein